MLNLEFQPHPALLFELIGYECVDHLVPSLHDGFLIRSRSFHLLRLTQFERVPEAAASKDRHLDAWPRHVLQRVKLPELPDVHRIKTNRPVELNGRIKRCNRNPDVGRRGVRLTLRGADIGASTSA